MTVARLIDADALISAIVNTPSEAYICGIHPLTAIAERQKEILDLIENAEEADAVPVVHGRWLSEMHGNSNNGTCSVCGSHEHAYAFGWKYCPNCGAKMD